MHLILFAPQTFAEFLFSISLGTAVIPGRNEKQRLCKIWGGQIISNYWTRLSKISWFVSGEQINCLPKPNKEYLREAKRSAIFTQERSQEGEKHGFLTQEQNIICSQTQLDGIAHEHTIICRQLFAGHVVGSRANEKEATFVSNDKVYYDRPNPPLLGRICWFAFVLWCGYSSISFQSFVLRHLVIAPVRNTQKPLRACSTSLQYPGIRMKLRANTRKNSQHCWANNVRSCCVRSQQHATTCNRQGVQTDATCTV